MKNKHCYLFMLLIMCFSDTIFAQGFYGIVIDKKTKQPIFNALVIAKAGGIVKGSSVTDYDGKYEIKPLEGGFYDVIILLQAYDTCIVKKVSLAPNEDVKINTVSMDFMKLNYPDTKVIEFKKTVGYIEKPREVDYSLPTWSGNAVIANDSDIYKVQKGKK